jgi:hypothetical protein
MGYFERLQAACESILSNPELRPAIEAHPPYASFRGKADNSPTENSLLIKGSWLEKPKAVPKIRSMTGYRAAMEKVANLAEMEVSKDSYMYLDLLATLVGIFQYELENKDLETGIIPSGKQLVASQN